VPRSAVITDVLLTPGLISATIRTPAGQLRDHTGKKVAKLPRFKGDNTPCPLFFFCVCWHGTSKQYFRSKKTEVGGPAQRLQAAVEQLTGGHSNPALDFSRAISAGEC
jgi:hypothetical protein